MRRTLALIAVSLMLLSYGGLAGAALGASTGAPPLLRFVVLSDRTGGHAPGVYARVVGEINLLHPDLVVTVGDHIEGYGEDYERSSAEWDSVLTILNGIEAPVYMIPGNHDIWDDRSEAMYKAKTGFDPYYSFDYGNSHFIMLDTSRFEATSDFPSVQMEWLKSDLERHAEAEHIFVLFHKPLWAQTLAVGKPDALHDLFVKYGVDGVFNGHVHHYFATEYDGVQYTVMGSSGADLEAFGGQSVERGMFFQYGWATVTDRDYEFAVVRLGSVYPRNVVTADDVSEIARIEGDLVAVSPIRVADYTSVRAPVDVSIENVTDAPIEDVIRWDVPEGWTVEPGEESVSVGPGSTAVYTFMMANPGDLYPTPRMSCGYPLSNGAMLDVNLAPRVMRTVTGVVLAEPPVIDGDPSEDCWQSCNPATRLHAPYDTKVEGDTEFSFACDANNLYLSAICYDPDMVDLGASIEEHDGPVYSEDCVGYFFQPNPDSMEVYQIYINPLGTVFDQRITFDRSMWYTADRDWDGEYDVATQRMDDRWSVEIRIPLETIGGNVRANPVWRTNFRRKQARTHAAADWQMPIDYDPRTFGELTFE
jgi:predicted phosphodiesterase